MKPSQRYMRDVGLLLAFRSAYVALVNSSKKVSDDWSGDFTLQPNVDTSTWQQRMHEVAAASGAAGHAYARHGGTWSLRNMAYIQHNVDPVTNWEMSLTDPEQLSPQRVLSSVDAAVAAARRDAEEAAERESGMTGLIAGFLRWPSNLQEAVGPTGSRAQRGAAGAIGVFGQVTVGVLVTAVSAGVVAGIVALWGVAFG